jgi:hypothetical protein
MLGWPGAAWHLELVADPGGQTPPAPAGEDLLVLYLGRPADPALIQRMVNAGGRPRPRTGHAVTALRMRSYRPRPASTRRPTAISHRAAPGNHLARWAARPTVPIRPVEGSACGTVPAHPAEHRATARVGNRPDLLA